MPIYDARQAECTIFTYKEGLLSRVAHDLKISVRSFEIKVEADAIEATFDATSLRVLTAMKKGKPNSRALSDKDRATIEDNIRKEVLDSSRYGVVRFVSSSVERRGAGLSVKGELELHGAKRSIVAELRRDGQRYVTKVRLHQPEKGDQWFL